MNLYKIRINTTLLHYKYQYMTAVWEKLWTGYLSLYSDWLRAGRSGDRNPAGARFSAPVQTGPGAHTASCTMDTGSFSGRKERPRRGADHSPLLVPWSSKSRAIPLLPLWTARPVQSLSACTRVHFNFYLYLWKKIYSLSL